VCPTLTRYGVDLFLGGHLHNYERTYPVNKYKVQSKSYNPAVDTVHVVIGMAGDDEGLTYSWAKKPSWSAVRHTELGYATVEVINATNLRFEYVLSHSGEISDSFELVRLRD